MSTIVGLLQAIAREDTATPRPLDLAIVTEVFTNEGGSGDSNLAVNARLRGSALELQHVPVAVGRLGLSSVPRIGDLVIVGFLRGDLDAAVVIGSLYDEQIRPPDAAPDEVVYAVPDDGSAVRRIEIVLASGHTVTLQDEAVTVTMGATTLTVEADGSIVADASGDIVLNAGGDLLIEAGRNVTIKGGVDVDVEAGANLTAKANATASIEGAATAKLKGALTTIAGVTQFSSG